MGHRATLLGQLGILIAATACGTGGGGGAPDLQRIAALEPPVEHRSGAALFAARCAACHGKNATGTAGGPPLVHDYYRPSHHGDAAFHLAAQRGVVAHHWRFGNMPAVPGVTPEDLAAVTGFVRWLQREAGID